VLRITSAPPAGAKLFPSRTTSSARRSRIILSLSGGCETAMVSKPAVFAFLRENWVCTNRSQGAYSLNHRSHRELGCSHRNHPRFRWIMAEAAGSLNITRRAYGLEFGNHVLHAFDPDVQVTGSSG
jgi:hypothetical protein